jgi:photosystem II stability/assembly factor-like uncharacterized protein
VSRLRMFGALVTAMCLAWGTAQAGYQDPIDIPVLKTAAASQSLLLDVAVAGGRLVAVGERGHIVYSEDQGVNWVQADVPSRAHLNAICFVDAQQGWAVGEDAVILHTEDGGKSWQHQFDDRDAEVKGPLLDLHFFNNLEGLAVGVFNKIYHTVDGGSNWDVWQDRIDNPEEWHLFNITATSEQALYIGSEQGLMFRSLDGGKNFSPVQTDHFGSFHGMLARPGDDGRDQLVLFGVGGVVFTSLDGGESWNELDSPTEVGLYSGAWLEDGSALIVGSEGMVMKLDPSLQTISPFPTKDGHPISSVVVLESGKLVTTGIGIQKIDVLKQRQ